MEFRYRYKIKASDLWQAQMYYTYSSYIAVINVICIVSSIALLIALWDTSPVWMKLLILLFLSLFTVIQPVGAFRRAKRSLAGRENEIELYFYDKGMRISMDGKSETKTWDEIQAVVIRPTIVVIYMSGSQGYILANRVLGDTRKDFIRLLKGIKRETPRDDESGVTGDEKVQ